MHDQDIDTTPVHCHGSICSVSQSRSLGEDRHCYYNMTVHTCKTWTQSYPPCTYDKGSWQVSIRHVWDMIA